MWTSKILTPAEKVEMSTKKLVVTAVLALAFFSQSSMAAVTLSLLTNVLALLA